MTSPTCSTCQHWKEANRDGDLRRCARITEYWEATEWNDECERVSKPERANDLAFVQDGSDYHAELLTKASFFCAHHEPAE